MNEEGEILPKGITLTCSSGLNFTGIPETWPNNCTELAEKCTVPSLSDGSNLSPNPAVASELAVGEILTLSCNDSYVLEDGSSFYTTTCAAFTADTGNFFLKSNVNGVILNRQNLFLKYCQSSLD